MEHIAHPGPYEVVHVARIAHPGQTCADELSTIAHPSKTCADVIVNLYARRRVAHGEIALGTRRGAIRRRTR